MIVASGSHCSNITDSSSLFSSPLSASILLWAAVIVAHVFSSLYAESVACAYNTRVIASVKRHVTHPGGWAFCKRRCRVCEAGMAGYEEDWRYKTMCKRYTWFFMSVKTDEAVILSLILPQTSTQFSPRSLVPAEMRGRLSPERRRL